MEHLARLDESWGFVPYLCQGQTYLLCTSESDIRLPNINIIYKASHHNTHIVEVFWNGFLGDRMNM